MRIFFTNRFFGLAIFLVLGFIAGYYFSFFYSLLIPFLIIFILVSLFDGMQLGLQSRFETERICSDRFSNGDDNEITLKIRNASPLFVDMVIYDEVPEEFQLREPVAKIEADPGKTYTICYHLRPVFRGEYFFGDVNLIVRTRIGLIEWKYTLPARKKVKVYPSFIRLHQYELMAISDSLQMPGQKYTRKVGNSKEFDTIREYVTGDDPRHINWNATARSGSLKTNHYRDERSQDVFCLIDKSRVMKMPFNQMTLLDYSINASLVLGDVSLKKGDKFGMISFEDKVDSFLKPSIASRQLYQVMESLYSQQTTFAESDFPYLYEFIQRFVSQRSLMILFTNFESIHSLRRQLPYLKLINRKHLLVTIFFRNTEVDSLVNDEAKSIREIFDQSVAFQQLEEKRLIDEELRNAGISSIFTTPEALNVNVINKYIEVKKSRIL